LVELIGKKASILQVVTACADQSSAANSLGEYPSDADSCKAMLDVFDQVPDLYKPVSFWWKMGCINERLQKNDMALSCFLKAIERNVPSLEVFERIIRVGRVLCFINHLSMFDRYLHQVKTISHI
jgi:hypothetical protein